MIYKWCGPFTGSLAALWIVGIASCSDGRGVDEYE